MIEFQSEQKGPAIIKVIGVGGAGGNAINTMIDAGVKGVEFIAVNTDIQDLAKCKAAEKVQIGSNITKGLGAGSDPQLGQQSAHEDREKLQSIVEGSDMVFITAGLGGGTGTGASPVIAELAKNSKALTVAFVTKPFAREGKVRAAQAEDGIKELKNTVDSLIVIPNQKLLNINLIERNTPITQAFGVANDVLRHGVQSISDLINRVGFINVDFADVRRVMADTGSALMGIGIDAGENRAQRATEKAISNQLVEADSIEGAKGVLINISGNENLGMFEVDEALAPINDLVSDEAILIFGVIIDPELNDKIKVTVIATGFEPARRDDYMRGNGDPNNLEETVRQGFGSKPNNRYIQKNTQAKSYSNVVTGNNIIGSDLETDLEVPAYLRVLRRASRT
ncbi:cell division protein FtsZ [Candidatus Poribacteria bacterium]|nr:cell division protein FtsZ [Candidatus Poribacteria bacterium]